VETLDFLKDTSACPVDVFSFNYLHVIRMPIEICGRLCYPN